MYRSVDPCKDATQVHSESKETGHFPHFIWFYMDHVHFNMHFQKRPVESIFRKFKICWSLTHLSFKNILACKVKFVDS